MTEIKLYNTRTRSKEVFAPIDPDNVRMYVCGPTVYDRAHIGNARPVVVFDVLYRLLRHVYGENAVTYVRNFTDVDDRIIEKAVSTKGADETLEAATRRITDETIGWYHDDMDALGALRPTHEPRCTDDRMMRAMVAMSQELIDKGFAYAAEGHVLFAVEAYEKYGALSGRSVDDMIAGARVEVAPYKKNPMDFVIWKPSTDEQPGWESPWGRGRPGWHIECSAMAKELLGEVFDIHAGGIDLQFPHHENELAQSCCVHDTDRMANWWMHNEMLRVEGEKMSKSLGNFFTVRDLLNRGLSGPVVRYVLLSTHYRKTLDWKETAVSQAHEKIKQWVDVVGLRWQDYTAYPKNEFHGTLPSQEMLTVLCDDLNTHEALRLMDKRLEEAKSGGATEAFRLISDGILLGVLEAEVNADLAIEGMRGVSYTGDQRRMFSAEIEKVYDLASKWDQLRKEKKFQEADLLRDALKSAGVELRATVAGPQADLKSDFDAEAVREIVQ